MKVVYVAVKAFDEYAEGDLIPGAANWPFVGGYVSEGKVFPVLVATLPQDTQDALEEWETDMFGPKAVVDEPEEESDDDDESEEDEDGEDQPDPGTDGADDAGDAGTDDSDADSGDAADGTEGDAKAEAQPVKAAAKKAPAKSKKG